MPRKDFPDRETNARRVLPSNLLKKVQEYAGGMTLYIPARPNSRKDTQMRIIAMYNMGARQCDIARHLRVHKCYVSRVLKVERERVARVIMQACREG